MHIRNARPSDAELIVQFNRRLAIDSEDNIPDLATLRRGVARALVRPEFCRYFLAEEGDNLIGQVMITYEWSDWRDGILWWLQSVYVVPDHRRRGVFSSLHEHIRALAVVDPDVRGLCLYALASNARALATYENCGMRQNGYVVLEDMLVLPEPE